uniref:RNase H type-1 domain-containing protein n=1 Tax=Fagus sylvatica TaxID=28930 RepID=A0A2N9GI57_FAGSY
MKRAGMKKHKPMTQVAMARSKECIKTAYVPVTNANTVAPMADMSDNSNGANKSQWEAPIDSAIKINVDAALTPEAACIAAVARNHSGNIIRVWAKKINFLDPAIAEAAAINWALNLAIEEGFERVIVESDAKNCIDELSCPPEASSWRRNANQTAHALAKVAFTLCLPFSCNQDRLPPSVKEAWLRDLAFPLS